MSGQSRKILVLQHVAHIPLGTLNPLLKERGFRIRYINYAREPDAHVNVENYSGLVILGGPMGAYDTHRYPHLVSEMQIIEKALKLNLPTLGICLGAQLLAQAMGGAVRRHTEHEIGWYDIHLTKEGSQDPLLGHFRSSEKIFELHGDTFELPKGSVHLATSSTCANQAFRMGDRAYGLQFHLEVDAAMIHRWLSSRENRLLLEQTEGRITAEKIESDTANCIENSLQLSAKTFSRFLDHFGDWERQQIFGSGHEKNKL